MGSCTGETSMQALKSSSLTGASLKRHHPNWGIPNEGIFQ